MSLIFGKRKKKKNQERRTFIQSYKESSNRLIIYNKIYL